MSTSKRPAPSTASLWATIVWPLLLLLLVCPKQAAAAEPEADTALRASKAFTDAWNTHDGNAVLAVFSKDAQIRQRNAWIVHYGAQVDMRDVYGTSLSHEGDPPRQEGNEVVWATGTDEIGAWLALLSPVAPRVEATNHKVTGTTVTWRYRVPVPPDVRRIMPGMPELSGTAEARVVDGEITRLLLISAPDLPARREQILAQALATAYAGAPGQEPNAERHRIVPPQDTQERTTPSPRLWVLAAVLMLGSTALVAMCHRPPALDGSDAYRQ